MGSKWAWPLKPTKGPNVKNVDGGKRGASLIDNLTIARLNRHERGSEKMVKVATYFAMTLGAFVFWQSMDKVHVWIALHQDEKKERLEKEAEIRRVREELLQQAKQRDSLA
ncbi:hypothetical protein LWI28_016173 [Acer negundo]|uniref:Uncharacterized protein n=2 Tax=Acereae TaxID=1977919 RepID=A0AAD5ILZ2_ACENE|nr:hypothetical protein LWI28_016173 [Acer negundo]KAK4842214.1 hypothetical protein QYF36_017825 [Acer negundo]